MAQSDSAGASGVAVIDLERLVQKEPSEVAKFVQTLEKPGFFWLDLNNAAMAKDIVELERALYGSAKQYFDQPTAAKLKDKLEDIPPSSDRGYKSCETDESYEMSTRQLLRGDLKLPEALDAAGSQLRLFQAQCDGVARFLLSLLQDRLGMATTLERHHRPDRASESGLKLISEPSVARARDVIENKHCDSGTWTMLFYDCWGVHVCLSAKEDAAKHDGDKDDDDNAAGWMFLPPPPPGCVLVHPGSSLERLTAAKVRSPLHRVTQPSDGAAERYFLCYFLRPEDGLKEEWAAAAAAAATAAEAGVAAA